MAALLVATASLMILMIVTSHADTASPEAMPALRGEEAVSYLKQQGLHGSLGEAMAAARYGVHWSRHTPWKELPGAFYAGNAGQQMTAFFTGEGIHLEAKSVSQGKWQMGMKLTGLGYGERLLRVAAGELKVKGNRVEIERRVERQAASGESPTATDSRLQTPDSRLTEWYVNRAEGIEQGFKVNVAPGERREGERLRLHLAVEGDLQARLAEEGEAIDLLGKGGERKLRYDKLHVYDALGRELESGMRVEGEEVMLEVDERDAVYPLTIDPVFSQQQKLTSSDGAVFDQFGFCVGISGETVVVGAIGDDVGANSSQGSAYVFVRAGAVWSEQQKLTASDGAGGDQLGFSVGISGETIVVGARGHDVGANGAQGSAYVFVRNGTVWSEQQQLTASDGAANDFFGASVAISGETIVASIKDDDVGANDAQGSAYVFVRAGAVWSEQQKLTASDGAAGDFFGTSVAISGETIVVGALGDDIGANADQGSAYVFVRNGTVWNEQQQLTASDGAFIDNFGQAVGISGETVVVGAHNDDIGGISNQGSAYVFVRAGAVWSQQQKLTASDGTEADRFGFSVGISGETIVVGADGEDDVKGNANQGSAYIFFRQCITNTPPTITSSLITVVPGEPSIAAGITTVSDAEDAENTLTVTVNGGASATVNGVTVSGSSVDATGVVRVDVVATCEATTANFTLRVTDSGGLFAEANLQVEVTANAPPVITCPLNQVVKAATPGSTTVVVNYPPPVATDDCGTPNVVCLPPSGSAFPLGTTTVTCTATDSTGNTATCSFTVTSFDVCLQDDSNAATVLLLNSVTGDYRFCCNGSVFSGKGTVQKLGSTLTLTHNTAERRVTAKLEGALNRGTASLQSPVGTMRCTISDRDIRNNSCQCQ